MTVFTRKEAYGTNEIFNLRSQEETLRKAFKERALLINREKGYVSVDFVNQIIDPNLNDKAAEILSSMIVLEDKKINKVVPVPTMGNYLGTAISQKLGATLMPGRKDGQVPSSWKDVIVVENKESFTTEKPGTFVFNQLRPDDNILLVDDFLARGKTLKTIISAFREHGIEPSVAVYCVKMFQEGYDKLLSMGVNPLFVLGINIEDDGTLSLTPPNFPR